MDKVDDDGEIVGLRRTQNIKAASTPPMSPGKRVLRVVTSPGRFIKTTLKEGSVNSSVFSLVIVCLGAGTLTIPNVMYENGFIFGAILILFGGFLSAFSGYLIAYCAHKTNGSCYEEIALAIFGKRMMKFTSYCMIPTNMGFILNYYVVVSNLPRCADVFFCSSSKHICHTRSSLHLARSCQLSAVTLFGDKHSGSLSSL